MSADAVGGVWTYALELAAALGARGIPVVLATLGPRPDRGQRRAATRLANLTLVEGRFAKLEWMTPDPWDDVRRAGEWLLELEARLSPDVVHLNDFASGALPFRAPKIVVGHSCVLSWFEAVRGEPAPPSWEHYRRVVAAGLRGADAVVAPTRAMLDSLVRLYEGAPLRAARVIPNVRDREQFMPDTKEPLILGAGRLWDEAKNLATLDRIAHQLSWPVYLAGARRAPDGANVALGGGSKWLGSLPTAKLAAWMGRASIFALPARYEPFGLTALEAALCGCALVLGDIASLREVWGEEAIYVDPENSEALRGALERLIADAPMRQRLARRGFSRARSHSPRTMANAYEALYAQLIAARRHQLAKPPATPPQPDAAAS